MRVVGNCEYAVLLYKDKLPKFRNEGRMVFNALPYQRDNVTPNVHPTQKSIYVISNLIRVFSDPGDVIIDPVAGSGVTLLAAEQLGRKSFGFEIKKEYCEAFESILSQNIQQTLSEVEAIA
jgi:site-specific DNA-methyltransferase (adenine-specific)